VKFRNEPERVLEIKELTTATSSAEFADSKLKNAEPVKVIFNFEMGG
jgi:hypothetical protein